MKMSSWFVIRHDTHQHVQLQKLARALKIDMKTRVRQKTIRLHKHGGRSASFNIVYSFIHVYGN